MIPRAAAGDSTPPPLQIGQLILPSSAAAPQRDSGSSAAARSASVGDSLDGDGAAEHQPVSPASSAESISPVSCSSPASPSLPLTTAATSGSATTAGGAVITGEAVRQRLPAAALILLRTRDKAIEVLIGQIEVLDGVASSPLEGPAINPFPGEYRVPARQLRRTQERHGRQGRGGLGQGRARTPLETACEELVELGFPIPKEGLNATLFAKESVHTASRDYRVLYFVAYESENAVVRQTDISEINARLREIRRQRRAMMLDGSYWERSRREKERLSPKLHHLEWRNLAEVLVESDPSRPYANDWQREQFAAYHVKARQVGRDMLAVLERIAKLDSLRSVQEHAIESLVRSVAQAKEISEETWRAQLEEDVDIMKGVNEITLLSYNLNALPIESALLPGGHASEQGFTSRERLSQFVTQISDRKFDIVALQEVFSSPILVPWCRQRYLIERMKKLGYRNYVRSRPLGLHFRLTRRKWTDSGLLIFSRLPIEKQDDIVFSEDAIGLDAGASKGCLYACVRTVERTLHVFNCHLQATHMSEADYAQVRSRQLSQLRDFITTKTFGTRDPWVLTGDFNIDAIATTDERSGEFGFAFQAPRAQSDAYEWLLRSLSPRGDVINLLQETHGRHVCTRPPRLSFPDSASYAFKHKYPQCLDYIFFCNGSVGSIKRTRRSTRVEKFQAVHRPDDQASSHKQRIAVSLLLLAILSIVLLHLGRRDSVLYPSAWVCWRSGLTVGTGCVLYAAMSAHALAGERWYGQSRLPSRHSYDYLSDHFGLSTSFSAEVTYNWQNLAPSLSAMVGDTPVHQQRADQLLAWRRTLSTAVAGSTAALAYAELFGNSAAHYAEHMSQPTTLGLILLLTWGMAYAVRRLVEHTALAIRRNPSANAGGSAAEALCFSSCHPTFGRDPLPSDSGLPLASTVREPPKTVFDCLIQGVELYGNLRCLGVREIRAGGGLGEYKWMSYDEVSRRAENFGAGLKRLALELAMEDDSRGKGRARKDSFDRNEGGADAGVNQDWMRRQPRISGKEAADEDDSSILYAHQPLLGSTMSPRAAGTHDIGLTNAARGLVRGDHIGIVTENCCEFVLVDHACTKYSLVSVTLETFGREFFSKLLKCSEARVIVASRAWMSEVLTLYSTGFCPSLRFVVQVEKVGYDEQVLAKKAGLPIFDFDFVEKKGDRNPLPVEPPNTDDVYTIAYRWHSDNCEPVGWEVTHGNLAANATAMGDLYRFSAAERHFSYVPMSHVGERVVLAACLQNGARIGIFMADQPLIYHDIRKLCPTFLLSTPQGFSAPFNVAEQALERAPLRKWLTRFGLRYKARARSSKRTPGCCSRITVSMIDALIFQKFIAQTGGQVRRIFVLSDATQNYMDNHLEKRTQLILNCPVYKALVLPEVGGFLAVSHPGSNDSATIPGMVLHPELRVKLQPLNLQLRPDDLPCAELLLKGPSLSTVAKPFRESVAPNVTASKGGGLRRAKTMDDMSSVKRVDSVTFDNLDWVHTGIICEAIGPSKVHKPGTWNVRFRDVEETIFSRPAVIAGGQGSLLSPSSGRDTVLRVVGRASSIIKVGPDCVPLLAEAVECVYRSRVNLVRQIWCHAPPQWQQISPPPDGWPTDGEGAPAVGLCAVISVNHEEAYKWVAAHQLDLSSAHRRQDARVRAVLRAAERWWAVDVGAGRGRTAGRGGGGEQGAESAATDAWQNSDVQTNNDEGRQEDSGNAIEEWSIRFTRLPDTGKTYFRRLRLWAVASSASAEHLQMEVCGVSTQEPVETEPVLHEDMAMVCDLPQLREYLQSELDAIHSREDSLPPEARVLRLHLTAEPFHAANKLQTPNFRLCRPNLTKKYSKYFAQR